jgi:hypothetical protein
MPEHGRRLHVPDPDCPLSAQGVEIIEVGNVWQADDGDINRCARSALIDSMKCHGVFLRQGQVGQVRDHSQYRRATTLFEDTDAVSKKGTIAAKLVDDQAPNKAALLRGEEVQSSQELSKDPATVNISNEQHGTLGMAGHGHVDHVEGA